jgi:neuronal calcium sensor 1
LIYFSFILTNKDKNGLINFKEFLISYALTSRGDLKSKLEFVFRMYDKDSNLKLDEYELEEVLNGMLYLLNSKETNSKALAKQIIKELDLSKDGTISKDEFINGLLKNYGLRAIMNPF